MTWTNLSTILLLLRVQPLPVAYSTNNTTNNTAKLLSRILLCEFLPIHTPVTIVFDSVVVHIQYLSLLSNTYTNRQRTRMVFPALVMLTQKLEATPPTTLLLNNTSAIPSISTEIVTPTLHDTIATQIRHINPRGKKKKPDKHNASISPHLYVKSNHISSGQMDTPNTMLNRNRA